MKGYALLFARQIFWRPIRTYKLLRLFGKHMKRSDIFKLLWSPFRRRTLSRSPELPASMIDSGLKEPHRAPSPVKIPQVFYNQDGKRFSDIRNSFKSASRRGLQLRRQSPP
jgi:hypothetical protein